MERLMQYRFTNGVGLEGHSLGNLLLAALTDLEQGFDHGLEAAAQILAVNGRVLPATLTTGVTLNAMTRSGTLVQGESTIGVAPGALRRVWLEPAPLPVNPAALEAVWDADVIVIGPGSLYTSVIPAFLVDGLREGIRDSSAPKMFVCNVATQVGETDGYGVAEHLQALAEHADIPITHLIVNTNVVAFPSETGQVAVETRWPQGFSGRFVPADVVDEELRTRHDPDKLARVIMDLVKR